MAKTIEVEISPTGEITINAKGYEGKGCVEATKFLEDALGTVEKRTKNRDYHKKEKIQRRMTNG